ncbi:peptide chain release factor N(5)-glutamine methyltransferase [Stagnimonas aquatica]|uniref:Release factor glutamine methyltransferase n=1 Tax=Stagnimonas aquatica TaxID=2689987 RepID=A0A3N0VEJ5_9GAMM|nr:peptide chain release factor N(5)-glutamine methyltransferase [Stagnimonas aquatica]
MIEALLREATPQLAAVSESPRAEAERLLAEVLGSSRTRLAAGLAAAPSAEQVRRYQQWLARRAAGEPYAYLSGQQPFRQIELQVNPAVLIPRADTEHLVDWALERIAAWQATGCAAPQVWDVCTGSGCVALSIAEASPAARLLASDLSPAALAVARGNAEALGLSRVELVEADGLDWPTPVPFELIVGNPPYIAEDDPHLPALRHEPRLALVSGPDGLDCLRRLIAQAPARLASGGWLLLEHGYDQGAAVRALLLAAGFVEVSSRRDYGGQERVSGGRWPGVAR